MSELAEIKALSDTPDNPSYLFYGGPGVGKTWLASLHPGKRKLWLDMDQRINEMSALPNKDTIQAWMPNEALHDVTSGILIPWSPDPKNVGHGRLPSKEP